MSKARSTPFPKGRGRRHEGHVHRAKCAIDFIRSKYTYGQKVFIATHGTYLTSFMYAALGISPETSRFRFGCENSSFNRIMYYTDGKILLEAANDISHLRLWGDDLIPRQEVCLFKTNEASFRGKILKTYRNFFLCGCKVFNLETIYQHSSNIL